MTLSWNEITHRALTFQKEWEGERRERAEKDDTARIEYLFQLYKEYTDPLFGKEKKKMRGGRGCI